MWRAQKEKKKCNGSIEKLPKDGKVVVLGDMNAEVGEEERRKMVGKLRVRGRYQNGECLSGLCAEESCFSVIHFLKRYHTWRRVLNGREVKSRTDYIVGDEKFADSKRENGGIRPPPGDGSGSGMGKQEGRCEGEIYERRLGKTEGGGKYSEVEKRINKGC